MSCLVVNVWRRKQLPRESGLPVVAGIVMSACYYVRQRGLARVNHHHHLQPHQQQQLQQRYPPVWTPPSSTQQMNYYSFLSSLQARRPRDSREKIHDCDSPGCGKRFYERCTLFRHQRLKHGREAKFCRRPVITVSLTSTHSEVSPSPNYEVSRADANGAVQPSLSEALPYSQSAVQPSPSEALQYSHSDSLISLPRDMVPPSHKDAVMLLPGDALPYSQSDIVPPPHVDAVMSLHGDALPTLPRNSAVTSSQSEMILLSQDDAEMSLSPPEDIALVSLPPSPDAAVVLLSPPQDNIVVSP